MIYKHNVVFLCNILFFRIKSEKSFVFRRKIIDFLKLTNHIVDFPLTAACLGVCCFVFDVISGIVQQPSLLPVIDLKFQNLHNISGDLPVGDREHDFDPPVEVAGHPVGTGAIEAFFCAEAEYSCVFQIAVNDTDYPQIFAIFRNQR